MLRDYLENVNLEFINNDSVGTETELIRFHTNIKYYDDDIQDDIVIGKANINVYNSTLYTIYSIRMMAQIDGNSSFEYQTLNSVRIFDSREEKFEFEYKGGQYIDEPLHEKDVFSFDQEETKEMKSWINYDELTENIYGIFATIEDIEFEKEYISKECFTVTINKIESFYKRLGINFILVMPFPLMIDNDMDEFTYKKTVKEVANWYEELGYKRTQGKLNNYCLVKMINE